MSHRLVSLKKNTKVECCPECGNNTDFEAHSEYAAVDCCHIWVTCTCGYDPTEKDTDSRFEDIYGLLDDAGVYAALMCWNQAIAECYDIAS